MGFEGLEVGVEGLEECLELLLCLAVEGADLVDVIGAEEGECLLAGGFVVLAGDFVSDLCG